MSAKDCSHHHHYCRKKLLRRLLAGVLIFIALVLFIILLVYLILRPSKPHFILQDATVFAFNMSSTGGATLTTTLQITLAARNPNDKIGIYYDKIDVYAAYHNEQITLPTALPPTYQGHKDTTVWSPFLYGESVPVAPYIGLSLTQDEIAGTVMVNIRVSGRIRWKVGTFISGKYHLYVNCPAYINFGSKNNGDGGGVAVGPAAIKYQLIMDCHVDV